MAGRNLRVHVHVHAEDGTTLYLVEMLAARLSDTSDA